MNIPLQYIFNRLRYEIKTFVVLITCWNYNALFILHTSSAFWLEREQYIDEAGSCGGSSRSNIFCPTTILFTESFLCKIPFLHLINEKRQITRDLFLCSIYMNGKIRYKRFVDSCDISYEQPSAGSIENQ